MENNYKKIIETDRFLIFIAFSLLAFEIITLIFLISFFKRSLQGEIIGIYALIIAFLMPSLLILQKLLQQNEKIKTIFKKFIIGVLCGIGLISLSLYAGDHGAAPIIFIGLFFQALVHLFSWIILCKLKPNE